MVRTLAPRLLSDHTPAAAIVERHAYCLCLHVRPGTIFVALINLCGSLIFALTGLYYLATDLNSSTASSPIKFPLVRATAISVLLCLLLAKVSAMLLYGALKAKPTYILPFFGVQLIDYLFTVPQFLASLYTSHPGHYYGHHGHSYYSYNSGSSIISPDNSSTSNLLGSDWPPLGTSSDELGGFNGGRLVLNGEGNNSTAAINLQYQLVVNSLLFTTLMLLFKTYFLCVVWKCYRYLHMMQYLVPLSLSGQLVGAEAMMAQSLAINRAGPHPNGNLQPPNYEEATKMPEFKPPEYRTVVEADNPSPSTGVQSATPGASIQAV